MNDPCLTLIPPPIRPILLSHTIMLHSMLLGPAHGAVSVLGFPLSGTNPSHPSPTSPLTHHLYPPSKPRLLTHGWPSTLPLPGYNLTPTEPAYPPTTPSPLSSIHYWMVRTRLLLIQPILPNPPPGIHSSLSTPPASFLHPPSLLNFQSPSQVQAAVSSLVSSLAFLDEYQSASNTGKARLLDGSTQQGPSTWHVRIPKAGRFRYLEQGTDLLSARAADLLACPPHLLDKNCLSCSFQPGLDRVPLGTDGRHFVYTAGEGSVSMVLSVIRFVMSSASFSNVAGFARLLSILCRIDR